MVLTLPDQEIGSNPGSSDQNSDTLTTELPPSKVRQAQDRLLYLRLEPGFAALCALLQA